MERLQKIIARAGLASRREAETWIQQGRVTVNGAVVKQLGSQADADRDKIKVDGKLIPRPALSYILFHKPPGLLTSMRDPQGRPDLGHWLESLGRKGRLFPVGRLDFNSSGLLLLTNDGPLAQRLTHPRYGVRKLYRVKVSGHPSESELERLRKGIRLEDGWTAPAKVSVVERLHKKAWVEIEIHEGRYREVRRMFETLGYFVEKLVRVRMGPLRLGSLGPGEYRSLSPREITALRKIVGL
ncbi:MAG: pseudouridine synthase [Deltaproteobacteria bacterium RIFCSPLOWO2_12_FULL_60_19]|nr:MAG: pseudouridine synthase [Deltaproteobacteria bacterium RIFCSPLOWO2_12_FULL_60_19]